MTLQERRKSKARARRIQTVQNQEKAVELRKRGLTYRAIAQQLGMSAPAVHKAVLKAMRAVRVKQDQDAEIVKTMELENLDRLQLAAWPGAMEGNHLLIDKILKVMERRAKLMGLDAPTKVAATDRQGEDLTTPKRIRDMSGDEIKARIRELQGEVGDGDSGK
jgi:DNA-binding CsgD family transcriptional regulator